MLACCPRTKFLRAQMASCNSVKLTCMRPFSRRKLAATLNIQNAAQVKSQGAPVPPPADVTPCVGEPAHTRSLLATRPSATLAQGPRANHPLGARFWPNPVHDQSGGNVSWHLSLYIIHDISAPLCWLLFRYASLFFTSERPRQVSNTVLP